LSPIRYWTGRRKERAKPEVGHPGLKANGRQALKGAIKGGTKTAVKGPAAKSTGRKGAGGDHLQLRNGQRHSARQRHVVMSSQEDTDMPDAYMEDIQQHAPGHPALDVHEVSGSEYEESEGGSEEAMESPDSDSIPLYFSRS
jgi:hypothetical protein